MSALLHTLLKGIYQRPVTAAATVALGGKLIPPGNTVLVRKDNDEALAYDILRLELAIVIDFLLGIVNVLSSVNKENRLRLLSDKLCQQIRLENMLTGVHGAVAVLNPLCLQVTITYDFWSTVLPVLVHLILNNLEKQTLPIEILVLRANQYRSAGI